MRPSLRAQPTPHASISRMHSGPCSQRSRASRSSQRPRPAASVSSKWWLQRSGVSEPSAAATVICAITVAPPRPIRLRSASMTVAPARAATIAAYIPAPPDPTIRTSVSACIGSWRIPALQVRHNRRLRGFAFARGDLDRLDDLGIGGATAKISREIVADCIHVRIRILVEELRGHKYEARRAIAALERARLDEGFLHRTELVAVSE